MLGRRGRTVPPTPERRRTVPPMPGRRGALVHSRSPVAPPRQRPRPRWPPGHGPGRRDQDSLARQEQQGPPEQVQLAATVHHRGHGEARDEAKRCPSPVWRAWCPSPVWWVRWPEQLQVASLPALLLSPQHLQQHLRPAWAWRLRREPRTGPPLIAEPRPRAARARRPARAAGHGEAAPRPPRLRALRGPERTKPHRVPFPGQQRGQRVRRPLARRRSIPRRKQTPTGLPLLPGQSVRAPGLLRARGHHL